MEAAAADGSGARDASDRHRRRGVGRGPVAELARVVAPPAPDRAVLKKRAGVEAPGVDGGGRGDTGRRELLGLTDGNGGIGGRHSDDLRNHLGVGESGDDRKDGRDNEELRLPVHLLPSSSVGAVTLREHRGVESRRDQSGGTPNQPWRNPEKLEGKALTRGPGRKAFSRTPLLEQP